MCLHIVMYHYVRDLGLNRYPSIKGLDAVFFRQQIEFLQQYFTIVRMEDVLAALDGGDIADNAALLTFDDGYIDHYTVVFPVLDAMGLQGSFFPPARILEESVLLDVNKVHFMLAAGETGAIFQALLSEIDRHRGTEYDIPDTDTLRDEYAKPSRYDSGEVIFIKRMLQTVLPERMRVAIADRLFARFVGVPMAVFAKELYLDTAQLLTMKRHGMYIGLHGFDHGWLGRMSASEYEADISLALQYMDGIGLIDRRAWVMNYPYGSWNDGVVDYIGQNGCLAGLSTRVAVADLATDHRLLLPRFDTNDFPPKSEGYLDPSSRRNQ